MGLINKLQDSSLGLKGVQPETSQNALPTSQVMAQGKPGNMKMKFDHSKHDLDGSTPSPMAAATKESQRLAQGSPGDMKIKPEHSIHDLNGVTPKKYLDNLPK